MADERPQVPPQLSLDAKWDACYDIALRRFFYSTLAGTASALVFFRTPVTRWATIAFGAGVGLGSAYTDCSHILDGSLAKCSPPTTASSSASLPSPSAPPLPPEE